MRRLRRLRGLRRLVATAVAAAALGAGTLAGAAPAGAVSTSAPVPTSVSPAAGGWWVCYANDQTQLGVCIGNFTGPIVL